MPRKIADHLKIRPEDWPAAEQEAWEAARHPGDVFDPGGPASEAPAASVKWMADAYGYWMGWLKRNGLLTEDASALDAICREHVASYVADLREVIASTTIAIRIRKLHQMVRALSPERDWAWLSTISRNLDRVAVPVRDKRAKLVSADVLYRFGIELMKEGEQLSQSDLFHGAVRYRDGMMIALLAARPILRRRNLSDLKVGDGIVKRGENYWLQVIAAEMKQRRHIEVSVPPELTPRLDRYLAHHRPYLFPRNHGWKQPIAQDPEACSHLWVSARGKGMEAHSIYGRFVQLTKAKFGKGVNPHLFRDAAATSIALEDPKHVRYAMNVLGHRKFATTERHYILAQSFEATQRHQQNVLTIRRRATARGVP